MQSFPTKEMWNKLKSEDTYIKKMPVGADNIFLMLLKIFLIIVFFNYIITKLQCHLNATNVADFS